MGPGHGTPEGPENLGSGVTHGPHRPWTADHSPRTIDHGLWTVGPQSQPKTKKHQKCPEAIKAKNHQKKGHDPKSTVGPIGPQNHILRHFQGQWKGFQLGKEGPKHQVGPLTMRYMNIYSLAIKI
ncbi:hypothetical protein O181_129543 [Austropuccinia psidii MF-1]|uniref:Uncharacterized protein n=1 Tax=Austropuccinia psidii MF-1 TaxID=1389203 RepID=A0A9Q3KWY5_9BASI|nr:hypothetical protein [Austropuccinia psidii MF-1]